MASLKTIKRFVAKIITGQDPLLVLQDKDQWNRQFEKGSWDRLAHHQPNTEHQAALIVESLPAEGVLRVLDVGCGNGGLTKLLAPHAHRIKYVGIDISDIAVAQAQIFLPSGTFIVGDAATPPDTLGTFDILVFNEVFFYLNPATVIPKYVAHAAPDAHIIISIIRSWRSIFLWNRIKKHLVLMHKESVRAKVGTPHIWDIAEGTLRA
ncbi:MAG: hypothetical protein RL150_602 [Candidatus Parcubacteria bacterium]|jgi:SAM-dependent methyltransferase